MGLFNSKDKSKEQCIDSNRNQGFIVIFNDNELCKAYLDFLNTEIQISNLSQNQKTIFSQLTQQTLNEKSIFGELQKNKLKEISIFCLYYHNQTRTDSTEKKLIQELEILESQINQTCTIKKCSIYLLNIINSNTQLTEFDQIKIKDKTTVQVISQITHQQKVLVTKQLTPLQNIQTLIVQFLDAQ